jgi:hypothetical protein
MSAEMTDIKLVRPGDVLIGFSGDGPVTVVNNIPGYSDTRSITFALANGQQVKVNVRRLGPGVRVLKSSW